MITKSRSKFFLLIKGGFIYKKNPRMSILEAFADNRILWFFSMRS